MEKIFIIGVGGFAGAVARYTVSGWVQNWTRSINFPYGTLAVNLLGCFLIGFLTVMGEKYNFFTSEMRTLIFIGFLGAFTTFSTFSNETLNLLRGSESWLAFLNVAANLVLGLFLVWGGRTLSGILWK